MPYAIVISAFPKTDLPLAHAQGNILHGLFYELLQKASAAKGEEAHGRKGIKFFDRAAPHRMAVPGRIPARRRGDEDSLYLSRWG